MIYFEEIRFKASDTLSLCTQKRNICQVLSSLLIMLGGFLFHVESANAERGSGVPIDLNVNIRMMRASSPTTPQPALVSTTEADEVLRISAGLSDLSEQLRGLEYTQFDLMETQEELIPARKKKQFTLPEGHTLVIRPLGAGEDRICIWLKWRDKSGAELLDTRLHLEPGVSMITGTEHTADTGLILAIAVSPTTMP